MSFRSAFTSVKHPTRARVATKMRALNALGAGNVARVTAFVIAISTSSWRKVTSGQRSKALTKLTPKGNI